METCVACKRELREDQFAPSTLHYRIVIRCRECVQANKRRRKLGALGLGVVKCDRCGKEIPCRNGAQRFCGSGCRRRALTLRLHDLPPYADIQMLQEQDGKCAACDALLPDDWSVIHVDHDHATGKIRGLLHARCNKGLVDGSETQFKFAVYLARHELDLREMCIGYSG